MIKTLGVCQKHTFLETSHVFDRKRTASEKRNNLFNPDQPLAQMMANVPPPFRNPDPHGWEVPIPAGQRVTNTVTKSFSAKQTFGVLYQQVPKRPFCEGYEVPVCKHYKLDNCTKLHCPYAHTGPKDVVKDRSETSWATAAVHSWEISCLTRMCWRSQN